MTAETANGKGGSIKRQRRNNRIPAGAIKQARIDNGMRFINAPIDLGNNLIDDVQQMRVVFEPHRSEREFAAPINVNLVEGAHQNI